MHNYIHLYILSDILQSNCNITQLSTSISSQTIENVIIEVMDKYDIIVVGAGHAGCEAALASAKLGFNTLLTTININTIGHLPCNCSIGGPAKGHLVREIDALGGQQALTTDATLTHLRLLNTGKGPAVHALRAQVDKVLYEKFMRKTIMAQTNLEIKQAMVEEVLVENGRVCGIRSQTGMEYGAKSVIITTGTFLKGLIHIGECQFQAGRAGEFSAQMLSDSLINLGFELGRLKTGTTPRLDKKSLDFSKCERQASEPEVGPFSYISPKIDRTDLLPCYLTYTNDRTKEVILSNLERSAMYGGRISGVGPRYCPSIEDKFVKFPDKIKHQVFLEQEGWDTDEIYVQGMSTSLPEEINPVTGCSKMSLGCQNCYAEKMAKRLKAMGQANYKNGFKLTLHPDVLEYPLKWKKSKIIFVNSMSDLFHEDIHISYIQKIFTIMNNTPQHTYQVLTKRSERLVEIANELKWTDNIWMGVTIEHQQYA